MAVTKKINLPSRGLLYDEKIPEGEVVISRMTVDQLSRLESAGVQATEKLDKMISSCSTLPNAFPVKDLLVTDRLALMLYIRVHSFGPYYDISFRCQHCDAHNKHSLNISEDLNEKTAKDDICEPVEIDLKDQGVKVGMRFLRGSDEEAVAKYAKRMLLKSNDMSDPSNVHRLARQLVTINGEPAGDIVQKQTFIKSLSAADGVRIAKFMDAIEPGIDLSITPECSSCGGVNEITMPFTGEFFRPSNL